MQKEGEVEVKAAYLRLLVVLPGRGEGRTLKSLIGAVDRIFGKTYPKNMACLHLRAMANLNWVDVSSCGDAQVFSVSRAGQEWQALAKAREDSLRVSKTKH